MADLDLQLEWLRARCAPLKEEGWNQPYAVKVNGEPWLLASNGCAFVVVKRDPAGAEAHAGVEQLVNARWARPGEEVPLADLLEWARPKAGETGRDATIGGLLVDRDLLVEFLGDLQAETVTVSVWDKQLFIRASEWAVLVMGLGDEPHGEPFKLRAPRADAPAAALKAVTYLLNRAQFEDPDLGYLLGWGTESFRLLCAAEAAAKGILAADVEAFRAKDRYPKHRRKPEVLELRDQVRRLREGEREEAIDD